MATPTTGEPGTPLYLTTGTYGSWTVITLRGELDLDTAPRLEAEAQAAVQDVEVPRLALDLEHLEFCDSSGLAAFVRIWRMVHGGAGDFVLLRPRPDLMRWLQITGLYSRIPVTDDLTDTERGENIAGSLTSA
ncbi:MAG TPA: STAS domain-containing protein [Thermomonospora sp.]|nr:STAS domain-containing protein [Thermomonospora sp.]